MAPKTGVLIVNLGTPAAPRFWPVRRYLKEFLSDPYVIDLPHWKWWPILNLIILNIRPWRSAKNYCKIWTDAGSPLLVETQKLVNQLKTHLPEMTITLGMRYGQPNLKSALQKLQQAQIDKLLILPLYPQYSGTTTATTFNQVTKLVRDSPTQPEIRLIHDYHQHPLYIQALADSIQNHWQKYGRPEKLLMSFHGLPKRYIEKGDPYLQQCDTTANLIRAALKIDSNFAPMVFQSRVGLEPWLQPYTYETIGSLAQAGIKNIQMICPGFACDCLETLEEINMQNREHFVAQGGEQFGYIPCLNDSPAQIKLLQALIHENLI